MSSSTILAIWVAFAAIFSVSSTPLGLSSNALSVGEPENKFKIDLIDVKCDKNENGMHVTVQFTEPFNGIIYSQGYFNDPKCRYVTAGEHELSFNFVVPFDGCGSKRSCAICDSVDNVLIIQQDEEVQGEFDAARKISCSRSGIEEEKKVFFKPFIVDMLDVVTVPTKHGGVDCWMDIQRGIFPKLTAVGEVIKIGEALTVLVYLRDPKDEYDLTVRNCWAYDNEDFDDRKTGKVQLSDVSGCSMKRKLFGSWHKTHETGSSGATLLLHNTLRAFKFPDESQVYLKCDIEICRGTCAEAICDADEIAKVDCALDPLHEKCIRDRVIERSQPPIGFTTLPTNKVSYHPSTTSKITSRIPFVETTRRPSYEYTTTQRANYISTTPLESESTTIRPLICTPDSRDIRCIQETTYAPEITTTYGGSTLIPNFPKTTTIKPGYDSFCKQYPKHKRCNQRVTDDFDSNIEILTFKPPSPFATVKYRPTTEIIPPNEFPSRNADFDATTEKIEERLNCRGPNLDPRCPNPTPTGTPPTYLPPSTTTKYDVTNAPRCYPGSLDPACPKIAIPSFPTFKPITKAPLTKQTTKKFFICVPGSNDVNCDVESTKVTDEPKFEKTTIPSLNQFTTTKRPEKPICSFGSTNPECRKVSTDILTLKPRPITTPIPQTTPKQVVSTTRAPLCYPGSFDPRCPQPTTTKRVFPSIAPGTVIKDVPSTTAAPRCYFGSTDPLCQPATTKKVTVSFGTPQVPNFPKIPSTTAIPSITRAPVCYPGALDPRCAQPTTTKRVFPSISTTEAQIKIVPSTTTAPSTTGAPRCYFGSTDPRCQPATTKKVSLSFGTTSQVTNFPKLPSTTAIPSTTRVPFTTTKFVAPETTTKIITKSPETVTLKVSTTTRAPFCYPGALDPRCAKTITSTAIPEITSTPKIDVRVPEISTLVPSTTRRPTCYPGSFDPRCAVPTTTKKVIPLITTTEEVITEVPKTTTRYVPIVTTNAPRCYLGSLDPRCSQPKTITTAIPEITTQKIVPKLPETSTFGIPSTTRTPICYPGSTDPRCVKPTIRVAIPEITTQKIAPKFPETSTFGIPSTTRTPICYPGSTDSRCVKPTIRVAIPEITTQKPVPKLPETSTFGIPSTTRAPFCYPGSLDPRCVKSITTKVPVPEITTQKIVPKFPETSTFGIPSTTRAPICYPGSLDSRCVKPTTRVAIPEITTQKFVPKLPETSTFGIPSTTRAPFCYPGSSDPRCAKINIPTTTKINIPEITTAKVAPRVPDLPTFTEPSTTRGPICYPGSFDPRCARPLPPTFNLISSTIKPISGKTPPRCYPGSFDPACATKQLVIPLDCGPGSSDPRCPNPTPTAEPATYLPPITTPSYKTIKPSIVTTPAARFTCTPFSTDPRCQSVTTRQNIPTDEPITTVTSSPETTTTRFVTTQRPAITTTRRIITTTIPITQRPTTTQRPFVITSTPGRFIPTVTTGEQRTTITESPEITTKIVTTRRPVITTTTQRPTTTQVPITQRPTTTQRPIIITSSPTPFCALNSLDPRCTRVTTDRIVPRVPDLIRPIETTTKLFPITTTSTQRPIISSKTPFTLPPFTTRIFSSPRPFTTRPTQVTSSTTENILCYPGSTIEGCKQTFTTPSYCFPGSKDKRCPQLPPSFSTRQPATYLPPYPDPKLNRVRRQAPIGEESHEIVKFSLSFKPFRF